MRLETAERIFDRAMADPALSRADRAQVAAWFCRRAYRDERDAREAFRLWEADQDASVGAATSPTGGRDDASA